MNREGAEQWGGGKRERARERKRRGGGGSGHSSIRYVQTLRFWKGSGREHNIRRKKGGRSDGGGERETTATTTDGRTTTRAEEREIRRKFRYIPSPLPPRRTERRTARLTDRSLPPPFPFLRLSPSLAREILKKIDRLSMRKNTIYEKDRGEGSWGRICVCAVGTNGRRERGEGDMTAAGI